MSRDALSRLIKSPDLEKLGLILNKPNIFEILKLSSREIRHSNFLAWLLDPSQSHNINDVLLRWFLKEVLSDCKVQDLDEFKVDSLSTMNAQIFREYKNIDILIVIPDELVVVMENKIWSKESNHQLRKYIDIVDKEFPNKNNKKMHKVFVFLTPYATNPVQISDANIYVSFDYLSIIRLLEDVLEIYKESFTEKVHGFIKDYIDILKRYIMKDDEAINLAQNIYKNHKAALDFIYEHKPDFMLTAAESINNAVKEKGYILGSPSKGYCRFITKDLNEKIPKSSERGWSNSESFLFEISYRNANKITLSSLISPGDESLRNKIKEALKNISGFRNPTSDKWSKTHTINSNIKVIDDKYEDQDLLKSDVYQWLNKHEDFILEVEAELLKVFN